MRGPLRILVAASAEGERHPILGALAAMGIDININSAINSRQLIEALGNDSYDCAFIDCQLPGLDGAALPRELLANGVDTPIVLFASVDHSLRSLEFLEAGAADYIGPAEMNSERLSRALFNAVRTRRAERRLAQAERNLGQKILHDGLTRLPNRALFFDRLSKALAAADRDNKPIALLLLDLNGFKKVNQSLGHLVGDQLLVLAADRLRGALPDPMSLARVGDDEFGVLLGPGANLARAVATAARLLEVMSLPFVIDGQDFALGSAIGMALHPSHGHTGEALMRGAEIAMRAAKKAATGFVVYGGEEEDDDNSGQLALAQEFRHAIENNELELFYQPKIAMATQRVSGVEALLRWRHRRFGMVYPDVFVPLAEQIGMIESMTRWVLDTALRQARQWQDQKLDLTVAVNLSALTLHNLGFPATVEMLLTKWGVEPARLMLEITESAIVLDAIRAIDIVTRLHQMGVQVSVDDFGTGYTSLSYIRKLPLREIKIDKSFVLNMRQNSDDAVIVRTIVELGHNLGLMVVAEGVEDAETLALLDQLGCDFAQGYYMGRPVDITSLGAWLKTSPWGLGAKMAAIA